MTYNYGVKLNSTHVFNKPENDDPNTWTNSKIQERIKAIERKLSLSEEGTDNLNRPKLIVEKQVLEGILKKRQAKRQGPGTVTEPKNRPSINTSGRLDISA